MATTHKTNMENCLKCGIKVQPPTFIVIYKKGNKLRKKSMPLRNFRASSNCNFVALELKNHHKFAVPLLKVEKMLRLIQELMKGTDKTKALEMIDEEYNTKSKGNLNKLSTHELDMQKEEMDIIFSKNQVKPDSPAFKYDKQVDFSHPEEESAWDKEEQEDFWG